MRRWIALAAKLYPRAWRERYGAEFDALMEEVEADWRELANVLGGAIRMQMRSGNAYLKVAAVTAVVGVIAALGVSFRVPERYVSSAVLRVTAPPGDDPQALEHFEIQKQEVLSRISLAELVERPSLNLYPDERRRMPLQSVVQQMRRDIEIRKQPNGNGNGFTFSVSFSYPDQLKAQAVARELTVRLVETNLTINRNHKRAWENMWHEAAPARETMEVLTPASNPQKPIGPNRLAFAAWGLGAGVLLGVVVASTVRQPKLTLRLAAFALAGCVLAGGVSFLWPARYVSTAAMRFGPPVDPKRWYATLPVEPASDHAVRLAREILSRKSLEELIRRPALDLYVREHGRVPMDAIVNEMRQDTSIQVLQPSPGFRISFTYSDPLMAQAVVREFVTQFVERNVTETRAHAKAVGGEFRMMEERKIGENLEVLEPASLPEAPVSPNRLAITGAGLAAGLLLGAGTRWKDGPRGPTITASVAMPAG